MSASNEKNKPKHDMFASAAEYHYGSEMQNEGARRRREAASDMFANLHLSNPEDYTADETEVISQAHLTARTGIITQ